jgi:hypothetical protein
MQVVCANCQLSFQAPEGATGLLCPICRSPLRPEVARTDGKADGEGKATGAAGESTSSSTQQALDWAGGTLDDLIALLSGPSWSARIEVLPPGKDGAAGEVHVIAGGVADAIYAGKSSHDSLDNLRAVVAKGTHFRVEPRLPNPEDGNLSAPGPEHGKLEDRPLATLMRYCEDFVLTCGIEVWRGSENAKVEYRRGDIVGVTVGGIDAPERLAEVMKWASGSYRLVVPKLTLPPTAPKSQAAPAPPAPRATGAANRTIFGMPAIDVATLAAARAKMAGAAAASPPASVNTSSATVQLSGSGLDSASSASTRSSSAASSGVLAHGGVVSGAAAEAPGAVNSGPSTAHLSASAPAPSPGIPSSTPPSRQNPNRTIFGVSAPSISVPGREPTGRTSTSPAPPALPGTIEGRAELPGQGIAKPPPTPRSARPAASVSLPEAPEMVATGKSGGAATTSGALARDDERTSPTRALGSPRATVNETGVLTYVGVGIVFGLALLGVYRLVMVALH